MDLPEIFKDFRRVYGIQNLTSFLIMDLIGFRIEDLV